MAPETIDVKNLPKGAVPIKQPNGTFLYEYMGYLYKADGTRGPTSELAEDAAQSQNDPIGWAIGRVFGFSPEDWQKVFMQTGIVLLGAVLGIIGVAMIISGTKTAAIVKSAIPVAGKVL